MKKLLIATYLISIASLGNAQEYKFLEEAIKNRNTTASLNLRGKGIEILAPEVGQLQKLERLSLWNNKLQTFPDEVFTLINLNYFNMRENNFSILSSNIKNLKTLDQLEIQKNKFDSLPYTFSDLTNLTYLNMSFNNISSFTLFFNRL